MLEPSRADSSNVSPVAPEEASTGVETLRGVACLLIVALHVIGSSATSGLRLGEGTLYREFADLFTPLRVPLFTFLSGFVYAYFPAVSGRTGEFLRKKVARIGLPFITVSTIYFLLTFMAGDVNGRLPVEDFWRIYLFPYVHFWFLQAIALIFLVTAVLERVGALARPGAFAAVLGVATVASFLVGGITYDSFLSYDNAIYLAPFFLLGLGANRFRGIVASRSVAYACIALFVVSFAMHADIVWTLGASTPTAINLAVGLSGSLALLYVMPRLRWLELIGAYSFTIYLFHPFAVAPSRKVLESLGVDSPGVLFAMGVVAGVLCPILLERVARQWPVARRWLLGLSASRYRARTAKFA
jgi:glucan biosynthesis protein C